jgi:AraC-like DNA-binding protein
MTSLVTYLFLFIGLTMLIFTILLVTARKRSSVMYWLGFYVLCVGYIWFYYGLFRESRLSWAPWLLCSDILMECIAGPSLYRYAKSLLGRKPHGRSAISLLPFLPALAFLAYLVLLGPSARLPPSAVRGLNPTYFWDPLLDTLNTISDCYFFGYATLSTMIIIEAYRKGTAQFRRSFRGVLVYFLVGFMTFIGFALGHLLHSDSVLGLSVLLNGVNTTYLFFYSYRNPERTQKELRMPNVGDSASAQYAPRGLDVHKVLSQLGEIIEVEEGYRDPEINLQSLSIQLGIPNHQLSKILNESLGMNFRGYINRYRLEEAKRLLIEKSGMSILDIAYAVGFNSKSAFNSAFVKETGLSPSDYCKKLSGKS